MSDITPEELRLLGGFGTSIVGRALLRSADTIERQGARIDELEQQVAALREDAARWEYMRTSGVVLVIHDVPYRGRELDAPIDAARNKEA